VIPTPTFLTRIYFHNSRLLNYSLVKYVDALRRLWIQTFLSYWELAVGVVEGCSPRASSSKRISSSISDSSS
jgi:hypothetical protein